MKNSVAFFPRLILVCLSLLLCACGFHPRGSYQLPKELAHVYLEGGSPALREQMREQMRRSGGQLVDSRSNALMVITLFDEQFQRRTLSLSARENLTSTNCTIMWNMNWPRHKRQYCNHVSHLKSDAIIITTNKLSSRVTMKKPRYAMRWHNKWCTRSSTKPATRLKKVKNNAT